MRRKENRKKKEEKVKGKQKIYSKLINYFYLFLQIYFTYLSLL